MKTNRILTAIMCVLMLGGVAYLLFGPPHYWDSVAPNTEKKANEMVDEAIDRINEKDTETFTVEIRMHAPYTGTGYIDSGKYAGISVSSEVELDKGGKTAKLDIEEQFMPDGYGSEETIQRRKCAVDIRIDGNVLYVNRTSDGIEEILSYDDGQLVKGIEELFFGGSVDYCKTKSTQYNKYKDSDTRERYHVIRDIDLEGRFGDLCEAFGLKDPVTYNSASFIVSVNEGKMTLMRTSIRATEKQAYFAKLAEFLTGGFPFIMDEYEAEVELEFVL